MTAPAIEIRDLHKSYGKVEALRGLSFEVMPGEIYGLLGPNGAGKTTTLKIIVGLLRPSRGTVRVCGHDVVRERLRALKYVGYVPEYPACFQNLTVTDFLNFVCSLRGIPKGEMEEPMRYYLEEFGLWEKRGELVSSLSRGMLQKLLAVAAFLVRPKVLVMDEPMSGMDPEAQHVFKREVASMAARGVAVLISSHILDMVERFCTRIGIINEGRLVAEGTLEELRARASGEATLEEVFLRLVRGS